MILSLFMAHPVYAEDISFSKTIELEKELELNFSEMYDSAPIDVTSFRYANILIEKLPPEKMPDNLILPMEEDMMFEVRAFFFPNDQVPREVKSRERGRYPTLVYKGVEAKIEKENTVDREVPIRNQALLQVEIKAPYLVVRVQRKSGTAKKLRLSLYLRK